jgi:hypothetical protein
LLFLLFAPAACADRGEPRAAANEEHALPILTFDEQIQWAVSFTGLEPARGLDISAYGYEETGPVGLGTFQAGDISGALKVTSGRADPGRFPAGVSLAGEAILDEEERRPFVLGFTPIRNKGPLDLGRAILQVEGVPEISFEGFLSGEAPRAHDLSTSGRSNP